MNYDSFGYALAMRVMQSDLYPKLEERERAECDEMIRRGQGRSEGHKSWPSEVTEIAADMRDHGLRFDLNPTVCWSSYDTLHSAYLDYIKRMDECARDLGRTLLDWIEGRRPDEQDREFAKLLSEPHKPNCSECGGTGVVNLNMNDFGEIPPPCPVCHPTGDAK